MVRHLLWTLRKVELFQEVLVTCFKPGMFFTHGRAAGCICADLGGGRCEIGLQRVPRFDIFA